VGAWTLPGGGINFGEHPDAAVIRELEEETGLVGEIERFAGVFSHVYRQSRAAQGRDLHFLGILYHVRIVSGELRDEIDGSTDTSAWLSRADLDRPPARRDRPVRYRPRVPGPRAVKSSIGIDVAAPPDLLFRLARDVERWPRLLPHYVAADREGPPDPDGRLLVRFIARRPILPVLGLGLPVAWRSLTWSDADHRRLRFAHRGGATNGMDVTWRIEPVGTDGRRTRVEIEHEFRPRVSRAGHG